MNEAASALETFYEWVQESRKIVFFGGAGVSTESGIPDFRSKDGLYNQKYAYPPEMILSHSFFRSNPEEFFRFYRDKILIGGAKPNTTHLALAKLEKEGRLLSVVTQNIDGLHQAAGSKRVWELHGSTLRNTCERCGRKWGKDRIESQSGVPRCECGGIIKPDVVLYEEGLDDAVLRGAITDLANADMLIIGGTSLTVYPAAGLIDAYTGRRMALINRDATSGDRKAQLVLHCSLGSVFEYFLKD
ncbi:MAG: NAD-dependent protein deacylase [Eubacteriales bacterium]|nr:NAD-dependent protein deacylase [Eubacteriales bacterium]MDD3881597.1 NAD-dependent protein deacylase [Eubacteriales bacterium]MDD4512344.1 NAD-dependent protein deacylase [Eubacteriales bacterium]